MNNSAPVRIIDNEVPATFSSGSIKQLLQNIDRLKPQFLPLPDHFAKNCDTHTKERYATLLAAITMADGEVTDNEARLFYLLLGSLGLDKMPTVFFEQAHSLNLESLGDFFRAAKEANLSNIFILDSILLSRIDGPISEAAATILGEIAEILSMDSNALSGLSSLACHILGISSKITIPSCWGDVYYTMWKQFLPYRLTEGLLDFVYILPGTFIMGSPTGEESRWDDEIQHQVTITKGFYMQTTPVTQAQWRSVTGGNPSRNEKGGDSCPVENISWYHVRGFLEKLNSGGKAKYRLPTEAEWEYACRAGSEGARYGDIDSIAWYDSNSDDTTKPVARKQPNAWGLFDMLGNVWEWCSDIYTNYPSGNIVDPTGGSYGEQRVLRGGGHSVPYSSNCWNCIRHGECRAAQRCYSKDTREDKFYGFRIVRDI